MNRIFESFAAVVLSQLAVLAGCAGARPTTVAQVRFARPTPKLEEVVRFYRDGLGFPVIGRFEGHAGYDGVMIGLPGADRHLEFTRSRRGDTEATPGPENLLVLYFRDAAERDAAVARLARMGYAAVPPENPYWIGKAITVPDPDGWRVVLFHGLFTPTPDPGR